jgi:uncharacterized protein YndB with AHSA1/START domain
MPHYTAYERTMMSLLALLALALLLRGGQAHFHDGMTLRAEVRIEAPPDQVWNFLIQPGKRTGWHTGVISVLPLSDAQGIVGARSLLLYRDGGLTIELEETVSEFAPPWRWGVTRESEVFTSEIEITLAAAGAGSLVTYRERKMLWGFVDRYIAPWLRWKARRRLTHSMARLKLLAEREAADSAAAIPE